MRNLIEIIMKKERDRNARNINKTKSINDVLRPIYNLSIIFGLRVFGYPRNHTRTILSFIYSTLLYCMYNTLWYYSDRRFYNTKVFNLNATIAHLTYIINDILIFIIPAIGLYRNQVSPRIYSYCMY